MRDLIIFIAKMAKLGNLHISLSLPRCRSVTLLQSVYAAKSYDIVLHEPTVRPNDALNNRELTRDWYIGGFASFRELEDYLETNIKAGKNVFIKDMVFSASEWLQTTKLWERIPKPTVLLWIRNPKDVITSFNRVIADMKIDNMTSMLCNYNSMLDLHTAVKTKFRTLVYDSDVLVATPERYLKIIAVNLDMPVFGVLSWQPITAEQMVEYWKESKKKEHVFRWHSDAINSSGFTSAKVTADESDPAYMTLRSYCV